MSIALAVTLTALLICIGVIAWMMDTIEKLDKVNDNLMNENERLRDKIRRGIWYS